MKCFLVNLCRNNLSVTQGPTFRVPCFESVVLFEKITPTFFQFIVALNRFLVFFHIMLYQVILFDASKKKYLKKKQQKCL